MMKYFLITILTTIFLITGCVLSENKELKNETQKSTKSDKKSLHPGVDNAKEIFEMIKETNQTYLKN